MNIEDLNIKNDKIQKSLQVIAVLLAIIGAASAIAGAVVFYKDNIWRPKVSVISVDFDNSSAVVVINGFQQTIYGNDTVAAGGDWGVKLAGEYIGSTTLYDRIELVKSGLVQSVLYKI